MNKTHIALILDRSGSMSGIATDVIGSVNQFVKDQKEVDEECSFTLVQFDSQDPYEVIYNGDIKSFNKLTDKTYKPRASTPLVDAIGRGINTLGSELNQMKEKDRPDKVIFVIQTDGCENASREFTKAKVAEMIKHQTEKYKWQFLFLGADQDAFLAGKEFNLNPDNTMSYVNTAMSTTKVMNISSENIKKFRASGQSADLNYTAKQRKDAIS